MGAMLCLVYTYVASLCDLKLTGSRVKLTRSWSDCSDTVKRSPFGLFSSDLKNSAGLASHVCSNLRCFVIAEDGAIAPRPWKLPLSAFSTIQGASPLPPTSPCSPLLHFSVFYSSLLSTSLLSSQLFCSNSLPLFILSSPSPSPLRYPAWQTPDPIHKWNAELITIQLPFILFPFSL